MDALDKDHELVLATELSIAHLVRLRETDGMYLNDPVKQKRDDLELNFERYAEEAKGR